MTVYVFIRKKLPEFNSIERVFSMLQSRLRIQLVSMKYHSKGFWKRAGNLVFASKYRSLIVHLSGHDNYIFCLPLFKKSIITIHDIEGLYKYQGLKRWIYKKFWLELPINNSKIVTSVSEFTKYELIAQCRIKKSIHIIPNALALPIEFEDKIFDSECPRILQIGTKQNKNLLRLLEALKGIRCRLIIVGPEDPKLLNSLSQHNIDFEFHSLLTNEELIEEYRRADLLSFVSTYEGFGLPIIEAQAMGRVVVTSNLSSMPEVAGKGANYVDPYSIESIANGIVEVIENETLRNRLIAQGLENIKRFDPQKIANMYHELYLEVEA